MYPKTNYVPALIPEKKKHNYAQTLRQIRKELIASISKC